MKDHPTFLRLARASLKVKGNNTNEKLYKKMINDPGLSTYELKNRLGWSIGKTDGAIKRLLDEKKIFIKSVERDGRKVNLVYPEEMKPSNIVSIPIDEIVIGNPNWSDKAYMYALDSETIGVTGTPFPEWDEISGFQEQIQIHKTENELFFGFPTSFKSFYKLDEKYFTISLNENSVLIKVSGNIIT